MYVSVGVGISLENARNPQLLLRHLITYFNNFYSFGGQQNFLLTQYYALTDKIIC